MDIHNEENLVKELVETDKYGKLNKQVLSKQKQLISALPNECKSLFLDYEDVAAELTDYSNKFYFEKGMETSNVDTISEENIINK